MKQILCCVIFAFYTYSVYAAEPKAVTNETLLEKIEMYQSLNNKKFELVFDEIKNLRADMNKRFEQVDKRFEQVDKRFEQVDKRFEQVEKHFEQVEKRFEQVDKRIELMDKKFEKRFEQMERHLEKRFELVANEMKQLREDTNNRFDFNQQLIMFLLTMVVAVTVGIEIWRRIQEKNRIDPGEFDTITWIIAELSKCDERVRTIIRAAKEQKQLILPQKLAYAV
jgi:archaellum component FlaC